MGISRKQAMKRFESWLQDREENSINISQTETRFVAVGKPRDLDNSPFIEGAITDAEDFIFRLASLEGIPEEIREVPEKEKETLKSFWAALSGNPALSYQLLTPLQTLRSDHNQLIPQLQFLLRQVREQMLDQLPQSVLQKLETTVQEINISPSRPSIEEIFEAIETDVGKMESRGDVDVMQIINSLSKEGKSWLGRLLLHLVQNPDLETDVRVMLSQQDQVLP